MLNNVSRKCYDFESSKLCQDIIETGTEKCSYLVDSLEIGERSNSDECLLQRMSKCLVLKNYLHTDNK